MPLDSRSPADVLQLFDGDVPHSALIAHVTALRHDPDWRATLIARDQRCEVDLIHWATRARYRVDLEFVVTGAGPAWRTAATRRTS